MINEVDIYGLAFGCPKQQRKESCPLKEIDNLSLVEKVNWINGLSKERKEFIQEFHYCEFCSKTTGNLEL